MIFKPTYITVYKYAFMVALILAQSLFLLRLQKKDFFLLRFSACALIFFLFVSGYPTFNQSALTSSLMFSAFFLLSVIWAKICYAVNWRNCVFCAVAGYTLQHIASILYNLIMTLGGFGRSAQIYSDSVAKLDLFTVAIFIEVYALTYWCLYHFFGKKIRKNENITIKSPLLLGLMVLMMLVEIVLNAFVIYQQDVNLDLIYFVSASVTNMLCSLSVLVILFGLLLRKTLEDELEIVNHMWRQERKQFAISKETIDTINIKCHDMKHQIHTIRKAASINPEALKEIEQSLDIYDSIVKTGNQALDIILAEKGLYCQKHNIYINCIIDGQKLGFMSDMDIYSLFGNLIDNAIDSVMQLEVEKRLISISVKAQGKLLSVNSHNLYAGNLRMENGLPKTNKQDHNYHGFGIRSMVLIVNKYNGTISFDTANNVFNVNILFPLSPSESHTDTQVPTE